MSSNRNTLVDTLTQSHTFRETMAQPSLWKSWAAQLKDHADSISNWISTKNYDEIWFCGAGTSAFIGETLAVYLNRAPGHAKYRAIATTDFVSCPTNYVRADVRVLVVSFGRSGNSPETVGMLDILDKHAPEFDRLHFTCNAEGALNNLKAPGPGEQRIVLLPPETNDLGFAMTSSYSTMLLSALACLDEKPPMPLNQMIEELATGAETVLASALEFAQNREPMPLRSVYLGSGALLGAARESALKVLELTAGKLPTLWESTLGFRHGPKAFVDSDTLVHVMISNDPLTRRYDMDAANEIKDQFGSDAVLTMGPQRDNVDLFVPHVGNDAWSSVLYVIVAQIQAIVWSDNLNLNIDNPFSSGNLSRVVQGVNLYSMDG